MTREGENFISWNFDNTLYDTRKQCLNKELLEIFNQQRKDGLNVCIVTLRSYEECHHVRYHFPDVRIFYTDGHDEVRYLLFHCPVNIITHYDHKLETCLGLIHSRIKPIWTLGERVTSDMQKLEIKHFKEN